jgi:hypothetical protein
MDELYLRFAAIVVAALAMLGGLAGVFWRLQKKNQGFGPNSLRALPTCEIHGYVDEN